MLFALQSPHGDELLDLIDSEFVEEGDLQRAVELVKAGGGIAAAKRLASEEADKVFILLCFLHLHSKITIVPDAVHVVSLQWTVCPFSWAPSSSCRHLCCVAVYLCLVLQCLVCHSSAQHCTATLTTFCIAGPGFGAVSWRVRVKAVHGGHGVLCPGPPVLNTVTCEEFLVLVCILIGVLQQMDILSTVQMCVWCVRHKV